MLQIKFAELHNPLFLAGKNFGTKLDPSKLTGLKMEYERDLKEFYIHWSGEKAILPLTSVSYMLEGEAKVTPPQAHHPQIVGIASAQVSTPYGHVHEGPGAGKTGKSK